MTTQELKDYFKRLAKVYLKEAGTDMNKLVEQALESGREDFLGAAPWAFKERHDTITTTASTEAVNLPDDFEGLISVIEKDTNWGRKLQKYTPDEYDRLVPDSAGQSNNTPYAYKVYFDGSDDVWKLALYPTSSSAVTLYLTYHTMEEDGEIPNKYIGGLTAGIAQYLFMPGSERWTGAYNAFMSQIARLKLVDNPDVESISKMLDSSDAPNLNIDNWFEEYVAGRT